MLTVAWAGYVATLVVLAIYGAHRLSLTAIAVRGRASRPVRQPACPALPDELPTVTVQLPMYNERFVARRLIEAAAALAWPRDRLEIQILDDSTDDTTAVCAATTRRLRARGVDVSHIRRATRDGFKAGALQAGLATARGELVLILDADFVPPADLLRATVGHFSDPAIGMVQVRWEHLNRHSSALTEVQALLLDGHFAVEQLARARTGRMFNFNGTAGIWRRAAIESAGGWHGDTLTEDLDLSYRALLAGWRFAYVLEHAVPAELPADMNAFKSQQFRWAKGSVQVLRKLLPDVLRAPIPRVHKLEAVFHLTQNVPYLFTLVLVLLAVPALVIREGSRGELWAVHVPTLAATVVTMGGYLIASQRALGRGASGALARLPALIAVTAGICVSQARAVIEGLVGHTSEFVRTPKRGVTTDGSTRDSPSARGVTTDAGMRVGASAEIVPGEAGPGALATSWWRRYRGVRDLTAVAELALAGFFTAFVFYAATFARWSAIPLVGLLAAGFTYVGVRSWLRR